MCSSNVCPAFVTSMLIVVNVSVPSIAYGPSMLVVPASIGVMSPASNGSTMPASSGVVASIGVSASSDTSTIPLSGSATSASGGSTTTSASFIGVGSSASGELPVGVEQADDSSAAQSASPGHLIHAE